MRYSLFAALLCVLALAPRAGAAEWTRVGTFSGPAVSAGGGTIVAALDHGATIAFLKGAVVSRRLDALGGCYFTGDAGSQRAFAQCPDPGRPNRRAALVDLASGALTMVEMPDIHPAGTTVQITPLGIGRRWVALSYMRHHRNFTERYWNPATGALLEVRRDEPLFPNLDSEQPNRRPCRPVELVRDTVSYPEPPFPHARRTGRWIVSEWNNGVGAWRCGRERPMRVSRCPAGCRGAYNAGYGFVAWPTTGGVRAMALNSRRRFRLGGPANENAQLAFGGGRRIYASVPDASRKSFEIFVARLPRS